MLDIFTEKQREIVKRINKNFNYIKSPIISSSLIQVDGTLYLQGCCGFLRDSQKPYEVIIRNYDCSLSREIQDFWLKELSLLFPIKFEETTEIFYSIPHDIKSVLIPLYLEGFKGFLYTYASVHLAEKIFFKLPEIESTFKSLLTEYIESKKYIFDIVQNNTIKIASKEESLEFIKNLELVKDYESEMISERFNKLALSIFTKDSEEQDMYINDFLLNNGILCSQIYIFSSYQKTTLFRNKFISSNSYYRLRSSTDNRFYNPYSYARLFDPICNIILNIIKELRKELEDFPDIELLTAERIFKVSSSKFNRLQCHTAIRPLWENSTVVTTYIELKNKFPNLDPYLLFNISAALYQKSSFGNLWNTHFSFIDNKSPKEIIEIKKEKMKNYKYEGVLSSYADIFNKGTTHSLVFPSFTKYIIYEYLQNIEKYKLPL